MTKYNVGDLVITDGKSIDATELIYITDTSDEYEYIILHNTLCPELMGTHSMIHIKTLDLEENTMLAFDKNTYKEIICTCDIISLCNRGCKCGAMKEERNAKAQIF